MICAKCGANNPPESAYCGGCGSFLAPAPEAVARGSAPQQESSAIPPSEPQAQPAASVREDMPTFHSMDPVPGQSRPVDAVEEAPTVREAPVPSAPLVNEYKNADAFAPQSAAGAGAQPASPTPNFANSTPQGQAPWPAPLATPGYPSG